MKYILISLFILSGLFFISAGNAPIDNAYLAELKEKLQRCYDHCDIIRMECVRKNLRCYSCREECFSQYYLCEHKCRRFYSTPR